MIANSKHWSPEKLKILPSRSFFWPLWDQINEYLLGEGSGKYEEEYCESYSVHLWNHDPQVSDEVITPEYVTTSKSMYAKFVSPAYNDLSQATISLVFLTHNRLDKT